MEGGKEGGREAREGGRQGGGGSLGGMEGGIVLVLETWKRAQLAKKSSPTSVGTSSINSWKSHRKQGRRQTLSRNG